ncbi:MAG: hypothetical protein KME25_01525 [Symplocastrum torsivum CPER-KK1]|jgi:hypothetical protein|uniref:Uncharacterized protein n=1 Tax=Symplocastrum torsivum CPER-KK1 TaxID=450513 RepID=A0A951U7W3_9CYAN|nr:hypothetical protein [Symplocastrum torsivum CPER-KK1]
MNPSLIATPKFTRNQRIRFAGSLGKIKSYQPGSNTWTYVVEMEMEQNPDFDRVGNEASILLDEADINGY